MTTSGDYLHYQLPAVAARQGLDSRAKAARLTVPTMLREGPMELLSAWVKIKD